MLEAIGAIRSRDLSEQLAPRQQR